MEPNLFANRQVASVVPPPRPQINFESSGVGEARFKLKNHVAFELFVGLSITMLIFLIISCVPSFGRHFNNYLLGVFKRPLPENPAMYFDINCINSMKYEDFMEENQVQRCRTLRPINRMGPVIGISRLPV